MIVCPGLKRGLQARFASSLVDPKQEGSCNMFKHLFTLVVLAGIGYGCYLGYEKWQESLTPLDRAESALTARNFSDAVIQLQYANSQDPSNMRIMLMLAEAHYGNNQKSAAAALYRKAESLINDPEQSVSMRRHRERFAILRGSGY